MKFNFKLHIFHFMMFRTVAVTLGTVSVDLARMGLALEALSSMSGQSNSQKILSIIYTSLKIFRCPSLSSARWCYRLYSIILSSLGLLLSFLWVSQETNLDTFSALVFTVVECLAMQSYPLDQGQWPLFFFVERLTMCKCTSQLGSNHLCQLHKRCGTLVDLFNLRNDNSLGKHKSMPYTLIH